MVVTKDADPEEPIALLWASNGFRTHSKGVRHAEPIRPRRSCRDPHHDPAHGWGRERLARGGLVTPNGTVSLLKTTTLAAYHEGVEHYVTSFEFAGEGQEVGSIIPLPGVPTDVIKGGDWTLQRLIPETQPPVPAADEALFASAGSAARAEVILETKIDALDITVLKGGAHRGRELGPRARVLPAPGRARGARLLRRAESDLPGCPLQRRARREPRRADGAGHAGPHRDPHPEPVGASPHPGARPQGLRDRAGGRLPAHRPAAGDTSPGRALEGFDQSQRGLIQEVSEPASTTLLADLRSDRGMKWLPESDMWLTYIRINETAGNLKHDLAIDASGYGRPSPVAAGTQFPRVPRRGRSSGP